MLIWIFAGEGIGSAAWLTGLVETEISQELRARREIQARRSGEFGQQGLDLGLKRGEI